jgi:hypothetical protein
MPSHFLLRTAYPDSISSESSSADHDLAAVHVEGTGLKVILLKAPETAPLRSSIENGPELLLVVQARQSPRI